MAIIVEKKRGKTNRVISEFKNPAFSCLIWLYLWFSGIGISGGDVLKLGESIMWFCYLGFCSWFIEWECSIPTCLNWAEQRCSVDGSIGEVELVLTALYPQPYHELDLKRKSTTARLCEFWRRKGLQLLKCMQFVRSIVLIMWTKNWFVCGNNVIWFCWCNHLLCLVYTYCIIRIRQKGIWSREF